MLLLFPGPAPTRRFRKEVVVFQEVNLQTIPAFHCLQNIISLEFRKERFADRKEIIAAEIIEIGIADDLLQLLFWGACGIFVAMIMPQIRSISVSV